MGFGNRQNLFWAGILLAAIFNNAQGQTTGRNQESQGARMEKASKESETTEPRGNWNVVAPTFGGRQFWSDQFVHGEWRIQKNVYTGHCRLLDPTNFRRGWGSFETCLHTFEALKKLQNIEPLSGKAVILLHGLGRTRGSMSKLSRHFKEKGFLPINVEYASTRAPIREHAKSLHRIISHLDGVDEIYFVGHSMGNIVWRYYLNEYTDKETGTQGDPRIRATVMIAPPNHGAYVARVLKPTGLFGLLTGQSGKELASKDWEKFAESLTTPNHRFAIIAGKYNVNPMFRVDNDTTVSVEETKLIGAADFKLVESMHATIMANPEVIEEVDRFFESGYLVAANKVNPLR